MMTPVPICPIHKENNGCSLFWEFTIGDKHYQLFRCDTCDLVFYHPFPEIDYESHTDSIDAVKDYVHLNSNIEGLITNLLNSIPAEDCHSMLEVGCGFGFTLDFAKRILNMDVVGYEPSLYGEVGAKELGLDIRRRYLDVKDLQEKKFDVIFLSEVLEHIPDPISFIQLLREGLSKNGVLILTTPNYKKIKKDLSQPTDLALLSPGAHVILFSEKSLASLLRRAEFNYLSIDEGGSSLVAKTALKKKVNWKSFENKNHLIRKYYMEVLDNVSPDTLTYIGVLYRLLRNYIDFGNYKEANDLLNEYSFPALPPISEIEKIKTLEDINQITVSCGALLFYYTGMLKLNYQSDFDSAAAYFLASYRMCKKKLEEMPSVSVLEFEIVWLAAYHYALSLFNSGDHTQALEQIREILNFSQSPDNQYLPMPAPEIITLANQLKNRIKQQVGQTLN